MKMRRWKNFLLAGGYYLAILSLSLLPKSGVDAVNEVIPLPNDKVLHVGVYSGLGFLLGGLPYPTPWLGMAGSFLGALDEQVQRLAPGREVCVPDWIADILGISLGLALRRGFQR